MSSASGRQHRARRFNFPPASQVRTRLYQILEKAEANDRTSKLVDIFLVTMIFGSTIAAMLETVDALNESYAIIFYAVDFICGIIFTIEYLLRLWVCSVRPGYEKPIWGRLKYAFTPMALIDFLALAPFFLPLFLSSDLRLIRLFRLIRLLRLLKVLRYSDSLNTFKDVIRLKRSELIMTAVAVAFLLMLSSALIFHVEHDAQPEMFSSIPASMWWSIATLTTVGYGDMYPVTPMGRFVASFIALTGIGVFALPAAILGSGFVTILRRKRSRGTFCCPHCKKEINREGQGRSGAVDEAA